MDHPSTSVHSYQQQHDTTARSLNQQEVPGYQCLQHIPMSTLYKGQDSHSSFQQQRVLYSQDDRDDHASSQQLEYCEDRNEGRRPSTRVDMSPLNLQIIQSDQSQTGSREQEMLQHRDAYSQLNCAYSQLQRIHHPHQDNHHHHAYSQQQEPLPEPSQMTTRYKTASILQTSNNGSRPNTNGEVSGTGRNRLNTGALATVRTERELAPNPPPKSCHLTISADEAVKRLKKFCDHCYLTRWSDGHQCYVLTAYSKANTPKHSVKHFPIEIKIKNQEKVYKIRGKDLEFDRFDEMVEHYEGDAGGCQIDPSFCNIGKCLTKEHWEEYVKHGYMPPVTSSTHYTRAEEQQNHMACGPDTPSLQLLPDPPPKSYHLIITEKEAVHRLKKYRDHCYLTHFSKEKGCYMLTVYSKANSKDNRVGSFPIVISTKYGKRVYEIKGNHKGFDDFDKMLTHYAEHQINPGFMNIGECLTKEKWDEAVGHGKCNLL